MKSLFDVHFNVGSCLFLSGHDRCMCCYHQYLLHHICVNHVSNDKVYQSTKVIFDNKNIHLLSDVVKEKVGDLRLNMCFVLQSNSYNNISKCVMGYYTFTPIWALKQMGT